MLLATALKRYHFTNAEVLEFETRDVSPKEKENIDMQT
jgi:hypothetical protein